MNVEDLMKSGILFGLPALTGEDRERYNKDDQPDDWNGGDQLDD